MRRRCYSKSFDSYKYYGAKGIKVDDEWKDDFNSFAHWAYNNGGYYDQPKETCYGDLLSIDRIDSKKNYFASNCQFIIQRKNSGKSMVGKESYNRKRIVVWNDEKEFKKEYACQKYACEELNLNQSALSLVANGKRKLHKGYKAQYI